jgi:hypothetical protein
MNPAPGISGDTVWKHEKNAASTRAGRCGTVSKQVDIEFNFATSRAGLSPSLRRSFFQLRSGIS